MWDNAMAVLSAVFPDLKEYFALATTLKNIGIAAYTYYS